MYKLKPEVKSYWIDLPYGIRVEMRPVTTSAMQQAKSWAQKQIRDQGRTFATDEEKQDYAEVLTMKSCAVTCIKSWEGVGDPDPEKNTPAACTPENIQLLMEDFVVGSTFWEKVTKGLSEVIKEGNSSSPVANGTSAVGQDKSIVVPVEKKD